MLPACDANSSPVEAATLVEPSTGTTFRPDNEDALVDSEIATHSPSTVTAAAATFSSRYSPYWQATLALSPAQTQFTSTACVNFVTLFIDVMQQPKEQRTRCLQ